MRIQKYTAARILLLLFAIAALNVIAAESVYESSAYASDGGGLLKFERLEAAAPIRRLTLTESTGKSVLVWERQFDPNTSIYIPSQRNQDPYVGARVVAADVRGGLVVVLLKLNSKTNGLFGILPELRDNILNYREQWNGSDYLLRSFLRRPDGSWEVCLSAYPSTFWPDALNEEIVDVRINDKNSYVVKYKGAFDVLETATNRYASKMRTVGLGGYTEKHLLYDQKDQLLYTVDKAGISRSYVAGCVWWVGFDEFSRTNLVATNYGIVMKSHYERLKELGIVPDEFIFLKKVTPQDFEMRRKFGETKF